MTFPRGKRKFVPMDAQAIYGVNPVIEALCAGAEIESIHLAIGLRQGTRNQIEELAQPRGIRILKTDRKELDRMAGGGRHQGVVALARKPGLVELDALARLAGRPRTLILCLDGIQDPRNLGALARTARACGATGLVIPARRAAGVTPAALKSSAGALAHVPVARVKNMVRALEKLKQEGFWVSGAVVDDGQAPWAYDPGDKVALVLGSEGAGARRGVQAVFDHRVCIPTAVPGSLNVSVAGALLLYEWLVQGRSR